MVFNFSYQNENYFLEISLLFLIINIILIFKIEKSENDTIQINYLTKYCCSYIDKNNNDNEEFKALRDRYLQEIEGEKLNEKCKSRPKRTIKNVNKKEQNINNMIKKIEKLVKLNFMRKLEKMIQKQKLEKEHNYYSLLIYCYPKKRRKDFLIEEELNDLEYLYYKEIETRKWYERFWSIFKYKYDIISTFFIFNSLKEKLKEYKIYYLKIMIYLNTIAVSLVGNLFFLLIVRQCIKNIFLPKNLN